jgi:hypothetical protein
MRWRRGKIPLLLLAGNRTPIAQPVAFLCIDKDFKDELQIIYVQTIFKTTKINGGRKLF